MRGLSLAWFKIVIVLTLGGSLAWGFVRSGLASTPDASPPAAPTAPQAAPAYLIPLPLPDWNTLSIPSGLTRRQARAMLVKLAEESARPLQAQLTDLQQRGQVGDYTLLADQYLLAVQAVQPGALSDKPWAALAYQPGAKSLACAQPDPAALENLLLDLSRVQDLRRLSSPALTEGGPSIQVYFRPGSPLSYVQGWTTEALSQVTLEIERGGNLIYTASAESNGNQMYEFRNTLVGCAAVGSWSLQAGDLVRVIASDETQSETIVTPISTWAKPQSNETGGQTAPEHYVKVEVWQPDDEGYCNSNSIYDELVRTDANGEFNLNTDNLVDFDGRAIIYAHVQDDNANTTFTWVYAYQLAAYLGDPEIYGNYRPNEAFSAQLLRADQPVASLTGQASPDGDFYATFTTTIQVNDEIIFTGASGVLTQTIPAINLDMSYWEDSYNITGDTTPDRLVKAVKYSADRAFYCAPDGNTDCAQGLAYSGYIYLYLSSPIRRSDKVDVYVFDEQGNYTFRTFGPLRTIAGHLDTGKIEGFWPYGAGLQAILRSPDGALLWESEPFWAESDGYFALYSPVSLQPGQTLSVFSPVFSETLTLENLTGRMDGYAGVMSGQVSQPYGQVTVRGYTYEYPFGSPTVCQEIWADPDGNYQTYEEFSADQQPNQPQVNTFHPGAGNFGTAYARTASGHLTAVSSHAMQAEIYSGYATVKGFASQPNTRVELALESGPDFYTQVVTSTAEGAFTFILPPQFSLMPGDEISLYSSDGQTYSDSAGLMIPSLSAETDEINNLVVGQAPIGEAVRVFLHRIGSFWTRWSVSQDTYADEEGSFSASFADTYWYNCQAAGADQPCVWPEVQYVTYDGHFVRWEGSPPAAAFPDAFETDDSLSQASLYLGPQAHTLHSSEDADWISFTLASTSSRIIEVRNQGLGMDTVMELYDEQGYRIGFNDDGPEGTAPRLEMTLKPGVYYVRITPYSSYSTGYCEARYELHITIPSNDPPRLKTYLPLARGR